MKKLAALALTLSLQSCIVLQHNFTYPEYVKPLRLGEEMQPVLKEDLRLIFAYTCFPKKRHLPSSELELYADSVGRRRYAMEKINTPQAKYKIVFSNDSHDRQSTNHLQFKVKDKRTKEQYHFFDIRMDGTTETTYGQERYINYIHELADFLRN